MEKLAIYVHIPFCKRKCAYCDFASYAGREAIWERYFQALGGEIDGWAERLGGYEARSVFFGGGTPSLVDAACAYLARWASYRDRTCIVGWFEVENIPYEKYDVIAYFQGGTVMTSGGRGSITVEGSAPAGFDPVRITNGNASFDSSHYYKPDGNGVLSVDTGLTGSELDSQLSSDGGLRRQCVQGRELHRQHV